MKLWLYLMPTNVSFQKLEAEEIPCLTGTHSGYFANSLFADRWSHTTGHGAGKWIEITFGNSFGFDKSSMGFWPVPWSVGEMTWDIPVGWRKRGTSVEARALPVQYESHWTMDADGTIGKSKHGHTISRTTNDVMRLDGVIINGNSEVFVNE